MSSSARPPPRPCGSSRPLWPRSWTGQPTGSTTPPRGFVGQPSPGPILLEAPGIVARAVSVHQMLALKLAAWRDDVDIDDARILLRNCPSEESRDALRNRVEVFVPRGREQTAWYAFQDLWEDVHGAD